VDRERTSLALKLSSWTYKPIKFDCRGHRVGQEMECTGRYRLQAGRAGIEMEWLAGIWTARQLQMFTVVDTGKMEFLAPLL